MQKSLKRSLKIKFGSSVKGKVLPEDIDEIEIIDIDKEPEEKKEGKRHIVKIGLKQLLENELLFSVILHEGVWKGKRLAEIAGLRPYVLYRVDSSNLSRLERVKFSQALRKDGGVLKELGIIDLGRVFLVPIEKDEEFLSFLKRWGVKIPFRRRIFVIK